jgi:hypothetical protein
MGHRAATGWPTSRVIEPAGLLHARLIAALGGADLLNSGQGTSSTGSTR